MTTQAFNLSQFANFVNSSGQVSAAGLQAGVVVESGTTMLFYQASAPVGWTQVTSLNDYDLRLTSGVGGTTGGTTAYSTVFANQTPTITTSGLSAGATTLSSSQMPSHSHTTIASGNPYGTPAGCFQTASGIVSVSGLEAVSGNSTNSQGGGGSHTHSISGSASASAITLNVRYANIILCSKN